MSAMRSPFPPIADYAFLSDCHTGALVAPDGSVDWLCVPAFDSPSIFGNLLDRGAGSFRFGPYGNHVPSGREYNPGTNVLSTMWHAGRGWVWVQEALIMGPRTGKDCVTPHTRPPMDDDSEHMLIRHVTCIDGEVEVELVCEPIFDYGRTPAQWTLTGDDGHVADATGAGVTVRLASDLSMGIEGGAVRGRHVLHKGETAFCALSWADELQVPSDVDDAYARIHTTVSFWRDWLARARIPDHPFRHALERSALAIKGLTFMPTGATVAALTTSLPETPGGERNWDYRYTWMRDTTFTLQALHYLNLDWEAAEFMQFVADRAQQGRRAADHVRHRRPPRSARATLRPPQRLRRGQPGTDRQRCLRSATERRIRRRPGLGAAAHSAQPAPTGSTLAADQGAGRVRNKRMAAA